LPVLQNGTRIITIKLKNGIRALDLCNHVDGSLESWIKYLDMPEQYGIKKESLENLRVRVMSDAKATYYLGKFIQDFYYKECEIPIQLTVGATALRLFQQKFFGDLWQREDDFLSVFERMAYYGGRTELFRKGKYKILQADSKDIFNKIPIPQGIVTEPFLGPPSFSENKLPEIINQLSKLYLSFFQAATVLKKETPIVIVFPLWQTKAKKYWLPILPQIKRMSFIPDQLILSGKPWEYAVYQRPTQRVWRQIFVFRKQ
ncbi:DNA polymerase, partial [Patescibacteria group bacterium]|nr:DNA polymerase [Patescibacteria group bacterium]